MIIIPIPKSRVQSVPFGGNGKKSDDKFSKYDPKEVGKAVLLVTELNRDSNKELIEKLQDQLSDAWTEIDKLKKEKDELNKQNEKLVKGYEDKLAKKDADCKLFALQNGTLRSKLDDIKNDPNSFMVITDNDLAELLLKGELSKEMENGNIVHLSRL